MRAPRAGARRAAMAPVADAPTAPGIGPVVPRFGIAYFGVRDLDHASLDLARIAAEGFSWVLLPFTQDDALWEGRTFAELVRMARTQGLETVISPWGGRHFGGEGAEADLPIAEWLDRARETGADALHVDEPKPGLALEHVLDLWGDDQQVWLTMQPERTAELPTAVLDRVAVLGTDAYDGDVPARVAATTRFGAATGRLDLAWVQAFRIPAGREPLVGECVRAMAALAPRVGIWAWKGSTGRGALRSDDPNAVQDEVARVIAEVTLTRAA